MQGQGSLGKWLLEICQQQGLSLRQAGVKSGLSHSTIRDIINGAHPLPETIRKLAQAFGGNGANARLALEDKLLTLAGCRSERLEKAELNESVAQLMDKVRGLSQPQIKMMGYFADFLVEIEGKTEAALLKKVEDLEDILLVKESLGAPEEEAIGLEDYEHQRAGHV